MHSLARTRPLLAILGAFALLAGLAVPASLSPPSAAAVTTTAAVPDRERVLTHGHVDGFEVTYDAGSGKVVLSVKDDTRIYEPGSVYWAPEVTTFAYEDERSTMTLPPAAGPWAFLGVHGETRAWLGSQTGGDQGYAPWVGWSTERLRGSLDGTGITPASGSPVSLDVRIDGPGDVFAFQNGSFGEPINRYVDTTTSAGGTIPVTSNAHVHTNWIFTAEGDYTLVVTPSLATTEHGTIAGDPATYHVRIGERAPEPVTTSVSVTADAPEHVEGDTATFTAAQEPQTELSTYRWEIAPAGSDEFAPVEGATSDTYERGMTLADDGARVRAVLLDGERAAGTSDPVTLSVAQAAPAYVLTIEGLEDGYISGDDLRLDAVLEPAADGVTYRWERRDAQDTDFTPVDPAVDGPTFSTTVTADLEGTAFRVVALDTEGAELATSGPVEVGDVGDEPGPDPEPVTTRVTVSADAAEHVEGETATFTASQQPRTELSTYRWEIARSGNTFTPVKGATAATYDRKLTLADDGARVRAVLLDGERAAGTSAPVTLAVSAKPAPQPTPGESEPNREFVLSRGHVDGFEVTYDDDSDDLTLSIKDDTRIYAPGSTYRSPEDVTIAYEDERGVQRLPTADGVWSFLGAHGGKDAWIGSQTGADQEYLPWVGWSTERLLPSLAGSGLTPASGSPVTLNVTVEGPGEVFTFQNDSFGNPINRYLDTTRSANGSIPITANAHVHTNWVFTAAGDYHLTVTPSLKTTAGRTISGEPADYHVRVGAYTPPWEPLTDEELTEGNRGDLTLDASSYELGDLAEASSPSFTDGQELVAYVYSEPTSAGTASAQAGAVLVTIPTSVGTGAHKLAVYDSASGELVGWAPFTATAAGGPGSGGGTGGGTGGGIGGGAGAGGGAGGVGSQLPGAAGSAAPDPCVPTPVTSQVKSAAPGGISDGHFDFGSRVEDGELVASVKDDRKQPASWVAPSSLTFRLGDASKDEVPAGGDFSFLGAAGTPIWSIGQVQESGVPWLGWNTQHPTLVEAATGPVTYTLDAVDGPGKLGVYATGNFGGVGAKYFGTMDGFPRSTSVPLNQHVHGNWAFTEQGVYKVTFTLSVPVAGGRTLSDTATLTFSVGDSSGTTTKTTYVGKTASGESCELSAEQRAALATTGADPLSALALGALLLVTGSAMYGVSRRRRTGSAV
ncbi:TIGR03773 family transporter-associated surface protein [Oerskovia flava]|uniref:TIGR03773 family transporter-associated surface protein n=1 Tax=Oerskovia flava TaxID=2986422 RepID=UPI00223F61DF|nr:TIGR03773 family transporter-associated surface protein [Oerskovia sp. JB1-3-2]